MLSQAGRLQLIASIIQSILIYSFQVYDWPRLLLNQVQCWIRIFFLVRYPDSRDTPLISWHIC